MAGLPKHEPFDVLGRLLLGGERRIKKSPLSKDRFNILHGAVKTDIKTE